MDQFAGHRQGCNGAVRAHQRAGRPVRLANPIRSKAKQRGWAARPAGSPATSRVGRLEGWSPAFRRHRIPLTGQLTITFSEDSGGSRLTSSPVRATIAVAQRSRLADVRDGLGSDHQRSPGPSTSGASWRLSSDRPPAAPLSHADRLRDGGSVTTLAMHARSDGLAPRAIGVGNSTSPRAVVAARLVEAE